MKRASFGLLSLLALGDSAFSQTATDPNEGSRLISLGNSNYQFNWWAKAGVYYLVEVSDDLNTWHYLPHVFLGFGSVSSAVNFNINGGKFFVRLNTDPFNSDADGDGVPDGWEVLYGLNARGAGDSGADTDADGLSNLAEYQQERDPNSADNPAVALSAFGFATP